MADVWTMLLVTGIAGAVTGLGALPVFFRLSISHRVYDSALGLAAGIMASASVFGLIIPGTEDGGFRPVILGVLIGGIALLVGNRAIPHVHALYMEVRREDWSGSSLVDDETGIRQAALIGAAIVLHNAPEGLAMGIAFASGLDEVAYVLAIVIGVQNVPDGFAFAVPFGNTDIASSHLLLYTALSGFIPQVAAAIFGYGLVSVAVSLFPIAAGFAAGAMLGVIFRELIPSSHGHGHADAATLAFLIGFILLIVIEETITL